MSEDWITTAEAAESSGYNTEYIRRLARKGTLLAKKFGSAWQISRSSLTAYLLVTQNDSDNRSGPR